MLFAPLSVAAFTCVTASAHGDTDKSPVVAPAQSSGGGAAAPTPNDEAMALYEDAKTKYGHGDLDGALRALEGAYELSRRPEFLFNLGQLHRDLGHCELALAYYAEYLQKARDGSRREDAEATAEALREKCGEKTASLPATGSGTVPPPAVASPWTASRIVGWASVGAGVAAGLGAIAFAIKVQDDEKQYEAAGNSHELWDRVGRDLRANGQRDQNWEVGLAISSAGLLAGGILCLVLRKPDRTTPAVSILPGPRGAAASYTLEF